MRTALLLALVTACAAYDQELVNGIASWQYAPYSDEGTNIPVCASVRFVYNQDPARLR